VQRFHLVGVVFIALAVLAAVGSLFLREIGPIPATTEVEAGAAPALVS